MHQCKSFGQGCIPPEAALVPIPLLHQGWWMSSLLLQPLFSPTDPAILNGVYMSEALNPIFVDNFERDPTLTWQYFGSSTGFFRLYPGKRVEFGFALSVLHNNFAGQGLCHGRNQSGQSGSIPAPRRAGCSEQNTPAWAEGAEGRVLSPIRTSHSGTLPMQSQRSLLAGVLQKALKTL